MKLGMKIGLGYALLALVLVVAIGVTLVQTNRIQQVSDQLSGQLAPMNESALRILNGANYSMASLRGWVFLGGKEFKEGRAQAWEDDVQGLNKARKRLTDLVQEFGDDKQREQMKQINKILDSLKKHQAEVESKADMRDATVQAKADKDQALAIMRDKAAPTGAELQQTLDEFLDDLQPQVTKRRDEVANLIAFLKYVEWVLLIAGVILSGVVAALVTRSITRALPDLVRTSLAISEGDLARPSLPESGDEIGQVAGAFNKMTVFLKNLLSDAKETTAETSTSSSQIATAAQRGRSPVDRLQRDRSAGRERLRGNRQGHRTNDRRHETDQYGGPPTGAGHQPVGFQHNGD